MPMEVVLLLLLLRGLPTLHINPVRVVMGICTWGIPVARTCRLELQEIAVRVLVVVGLRRELVPGQVLVGARVLRVDVLVAEDPVEVVEGEEEEEAEDVEVEVGEVVRVRNG